MKTFRIRWLDPESGETKEETKSFEDTETVTAQEWAEDWAYSMADKGPYEIRLLLGDSAVA